MAKPDPYADIDFEEINEATGLANDEVKCLKVILINKHVNFTYLLILVSKIFIGRCALTCSTPRSRTSCLPMTWARS